MKEVFKVLRQNPPENFGVGVTFFFASFVFWLIGLLFVLNGVDIPSIFVAFFIGCIFFACSSAIIVRPFNAVRRFKKEFGFLPPVTPAARDALQRKVDDTLAYRARFFISSCSDAERALNDLRGFAEPQQHADNSRFVEDVYALESVLKQTNEKVKYDKRYFWKLHAIASSQYLPQPFKVLKSVHDYKDVTFNKPAKHDKEQAVVGG